MIDARTKHQLSLHGEFVPWLLANLSHSKTQLQTSTNFGITIFSSYQRARIYFKLSAFWSKTSLIMKVVGGKCGFGYVSQGV